MDTGANSIFFSSELDLVNVSGKGTLCVSVWGEGEVSIHWLSLQASLSRGAEVESAGQMFANRPVDDMPLTLSGKNFIVLEKEQN